MLHLTLRRFLAFCIDYILIAIYVLLILGIANILNLEELILTPISGQLLGFFSLTLPVFLYFFLTEKSISRATLGKRLLNIRVCAKINKTKPRILIRNFLKFLPWEVAHTGIHWVIFYSKSQNNEPVWVWALLLLPQIITAVYVFSIIISKGKSSVYDNISNTLIKINQNNSTYINQVK